MRRLVAVLVVATACNASPVDFREFDQQAGRSIVTAQAEAKLVRSPAIGPVHLLLGVLGNQQDPIGSVLTKQGLSRRAAESAAMPVSPDALLKAMRASPATESAHLKFTKSAKSVLERARVVADEDVTGDITSKHLVLALLDDREVQKLIAQVHVDRTTLRVAVTSA